MSTWNCIETMKPNVTSPIMKLDPDDKIKNVINTRCQTHDCASFGSQQKPKQQQQHRDHRGDVDPVEMCFESRGDKFFGTGERDRFDLPFHTGSLIQEREVCHQIHLKQNHQQQSGDRSDEEIPANDRIAKAAIQQPRP